jgi:hypothetical protein
MQITGRNRHILQALDTYRVKYNAGSATSPQRMSMT